MKVYFDQQSLATVISYHEVKNLSGVRIKVDKAIEDTINVIFFSLNCVYKFRPCGSGLYFLDVENIINHCYPSNDNSETVDTYSFVQSVASNKEF